MAFLETARRVAAGGGAVVRRLLRPRPKQPARVEPGSQSRRHQLHPGLCTGCGACARACPAGCLAVFTEQSVLTALHIDYGRCMECGLCVEACGEAALVAMSSPALIVGSRAELRRDLVSAAAASRT